MDDTKKHFISYFIIIMLGVSFICNIALGTTVIITERKLGRCLAELGYIRERNTEYSRLVENARQTNNGIGECVERCDGTIQSLRETLRGIERKYNEMASLLDNAGRDVRGGLGSNDTDNGGTEQCK